MLIQTNIAALETAKNLSRNQAMLANSFNRLSSGFRINSAKDDAAGLAISESMKMQIRSFVVAERNANDAISMAQTAEGALGELTGILGRMREIAVQGSNGSLQAVDRDYLETEFKQLQFEVARIMSNTKFNGVMLVNRASAAIAFQVGINNVTADRLTVTFGGLRLTSLLSMSTTLSGAATNAQAAIDVVDGALTRIATSRARYGAAMNRLEVTTSNLQTMRVNMSAANSRIRDVDVADETATLSRQQVLSQGGAAILAQANQAPQLALALLRG